MTDPLVDVSDGNPTRAAAIALQIQEDEQLAHTLYQKENKQVAFTEPAFLTKVSKAHKKQEKQEKQEKQPQTHQEAVNSVDERGSSTRQATRSPRTLSRRSSPSSKSPPSSSNGPLATKSASIGKTGQQTRLVMQLRDRILLGAKQEATLGIYAALQRTLRPKAAEDKMAFLHTFNEHIATEAAQLHNLLIQWIQEEGLHRNTPTLFERMRKIRFLPLFDATPPKTPVDWLAAVKNGQPQQQHKTTPPQHDSVTTGSTKFARVPRLMTPSEKTHLDDLIRGIQVAHTLPDFCFETLSPEVYNLITDAISTNVRGHLVMQLSAAFQMSKAITYQGKLRQFYSTSLPEQETITAFKQIMTHIDYDDSSHRLHITVLSKQLAKEWHGKYIPLRGRLQQLLLPTADADEDTADSALDLDEYSFALNVQGGAMNATTMRHLFQHILQLDIICNFQAGPNPSGYSDPCLWSVTLRSHGCPPALIGKTCIQWHKWTLWLQDIAAPSSGPCIRCAHASHTFQSCTSAHEYQQSNVLVLDKNGLDLDDILKPVQSLPLGTDYAQYFIDRLDCVRERSNMGAEDREAGEPIPTHTTQYKILQRTSTGWMATQWSTPAEKLARRKRVTAQLKAQQQQQKKILTQAQERAIALQRKADEEHREQARLELERSRQLEAERDSQSRLQRARSAALHAIIIPPAQAFTADSHPQPQMSENLTLHSPDSHDPPIPMDLDSTPPDSPIHPTTTLQPSYHVTANSMLSSTLQHAHNDMDEEEGAGQHTPNWRPAPLQIHLSTEAQANSPPCIPLALLPRTPSPSKRNRAQSIGDDTLDSPTTKCHRTMDAVTADARLGRDLQAQRDAAVRLGRSQKLSPQLPLTSKRSLEYELSPTKGDQQTRVYKQQTTISQFMVQVQRDTPSAQSSPITTQHDPMPPSSHAAPEDCGPSPPFDLPPQSDAPNTFEDLTRALNLREVDVPGFGSCFYYALVGATLQNHSGPRLLSHPNVDAHANLFRKEINEALITVLPLWSAQDLIAPGNLLKRYTGDTTEHDIPEAVSRISEHLRLSRLQLCERALPKCHWASHEECMATVVYLREPLFVFHVTSYGKTNIELYYLNDTHPVSAGQRDIVESIDLDPATAYMALASLLHNRVIPLIIAMKAGAHVAHFTALRVPDLFYAPWKASQSPNMRQRYNETLVSLGYPPIPDRPCPEYKSPPTSETHSDTTYSPSSKNSPSPESSFPLTDPLHLAPTPGFVGPTALADNNVPSPSPISLIIASSDSMATTVSPKTHTTDTPTEKEAQSVIDIDEATRLNAQAFRGWLKRERTKHQEFLSSGMTLTEAWQKLAHNPELCVAMIRALPHPDAALLTAPESALVQLGRQLILTGYSHIFERLARNQLTNKARQALNEWANAVTHAPDMQTKWTLLHHKSMWANARKHVGGIFRPLFTLHQLKINMARILICVMTHPTNMPEKWRTATLGSACDYVLNCLADRSCRPQILKTHHALQAGRWGASTALFDTHPTIASSTHQEELVSSDEEEIQILN
jgi:hypothetical protein